MSNTPSKKDLLSFVSQGLFEDVRDGDHTSIACIPPDGKTKARLLIKDVGVIAGVELAAMIFKYVDPESKVEVLIEDGTDVDYGEVAFTVECDSRALLKAERLVLNCMQRMSGIATMSARFATEVEGLPVTILDTRKTTPLNRMLQKWAVRIGGCDNYRDGLYDRIMIKDNHIDACGGITQAIDRCHEYLKREQLDLKITVEVRNLEELHKVLDRGGVERIMLDNFDLTLLREAVQIIGNQHETEASGGVNLETVRKIAETGVQYISVGALTHSAGSLDLSLKVMK